MRDTSERALDEAVAAEMKKLRAKLAPGEIVVMLDKETTNPDLDGQRWRFFATDGARVVQFEAGLSGTQAAIYGREIEKEQLEAAVARRAVAALPAEIRMDGLAEADPITLRADDLGPRPIPSAFT